MSSNPKVITITGTIDDVRAFLRDVQAMKSYPEGARVLTGLDLDACKASPEAVNILTLVLQEHPIVAWDDITITTWADITNNIPRLEEQRQLFVTMLTIATKIERAVATGDPIHVTLGGPHPDAVSFGSKPSNKSNKPNDHSPTLVRMTSEAVQAWWKTSDSYDLEEYNKLKPTDPEATTDTKDEARSGVDDRQNKAAKDDVNAEDNEAGPSRLPPKKSAESKKKRVKSNKKRVKSN